ncbi:hypothetical protein CAEBREN_06317 [Caenorhabditis brenneri]|uniref:Uncharacterized protein n=1 Tax=Caenorhabditis brenneri TaxID=135651 RepID=G0ME09_CAEBE|nr:hypothetical protein CAEBREN_06317 [Caenorhabditis brenneri]
MDYPVPNKSPKLLTKSELNQRASTNLRATPDSLPIINEEKCPKVFNLTDDVVLPDKEKEIANEDEKTHARGQGPSPFSNPRKRPLGLLPESDLNNSGFLGDDSSPLLMDPRTQKAQKPGTSWKLKDQTNSPSIKKSKLEEGFDGLHEDGVGYSRGLLRLAPEFKPDKLLYDNCNMKLKDVGVKKAEKKAKKVENHFFGNSKLPGPNGDSDHEDDSSDEDDDDGLELFGIKKCQYS